MKDKIVVGSLITLLILGAIAIVGIPIFFGFAGIFYIIGIEYESAFSLMIFVVIYFVIGFFIEIIFGGMAKVVQLQLHEKWLQVINTFLFSFAGNWLALFIAQFFVAGLTLSLKAFLILATILALVDFIGEDNKKEKQ